MYRIKVIGDGGKWRDCPEGPWDTVREAVRFARAEVGVPWCVVDQGCRYVYAVGDASGLLANGDPNEDAVLACKYAAAYDTAIRSCRNDHNRMQKWSGLKGETLDLLYMRWQQQADKVLELAKENRR